jgi:hypothetical protein
MRAKGSGDISIALFLISSGDQVCSCCLNVSFCSSASLNFDLVPYSQGLANVTCCVSETPPGLCPVGLFCSSISCKQFTILIPAILQLVSKGDTIIVGQSDFSSTHSRVVISAHIRVILPAVVGMMNASVSHSDACTSLFAVLPSAEICNVTFVDIAFVPDPRAVGERSITVTVAFVHDAGIDNSSETFTIRVERTNQMPLFSLLHPVISRLESSGSYFGMDFVSNISAGYGDSDQGVSFEVEEAFDCTNMFSSSQVFSLKHFVNSTGSLSFNLFPYVYGFFTFALRLIDSPAGTGLSPRNSSSSFFISTSFS